MTGTGTVDATHMFGDDPEMVHSSRSAISTGQLPDSDDVKTAVDETYEQFSSVDDGEVPDYIPALADADPDLFGICIVSTEGQAYSRGDAELLFTIQSISKAFVFALVREEVGHTKARELVGVNNTGLPFDSVMAIEINGGRTMNPLVNAGALATSALAPGETWEEKWDFILRGLSAFAGRDLKIDEDAFESERKNNIRNQGIARLLQSYGHITLDPHEVTELYTRQCALLVSTEDLAVMGATLADGGRNPKTGEQVIGQGASRDALAVMAANGLYEASGEWLYEIGMPAKSGVSGGLVTIAPGKGGFASYSPRLDDAGNSVRGIKAARHLSNELGMNLFASGTVQD
ncbi:glutaminase A [Pseudoclavibacter helvolus]|uniref:Glutaminase n=1 Tax=Pseudoclavibacter helvolus TaxID=255205 RepID=A0A7W4YDJ5_9MICO|nr:glutaminase [Pseudoclavibacter helvolus]